MSDPLALAKLLRPGVLDGVLVLLADADADGDVDGDGDGRRGGAGSFAAAVDAACAELGAQTRVWRAGEPVPAGVDLLVLDGAAAFDSGRAGASAEGTQAPARVALRACLDGAWEASHAVANAAFIEPGCGGRIVYLAPPSALGAETAAPVRGAAGGAEHADAARAGLENLARTLSIEWARYGVTTVAIATGPRTSPGEVAALCAYLASPAGAYFSGCVLDLRPPSA